MSAVWTVDLGPRAAKALRKLDRPVAKRITAMLKEIAELEDPRQRGKALAGNLSGLWSYRVGNYRVLCVFDDDSFIVLAIEIAHRSRVYNL